MVSTYPTLQFILTVKNTLNSNAYFVSWIDSVEEMACKRRSWLSHKRGKSVAFCGFQKIQRPNSAIEVLHAQFIWVLSIDSVERNGVQKMFLGTPQKAQNGCFLWVSEDSTSRFWNRSSSCATYLSVVNRFCWMKWRTKGVLGYTTKGTKLLLFVGFRRFNAQNPQSKFFMNNLFECREQILLKEMACKKRS